MKNKAILAIDMPKSCIDCKLNYEYYSCIITGTKFWNIKNIKDDFDPETQVLPDCPLSPLPSSIDLKQYADNTALNMESMLAYQYAQGWNTYRNEILKGEANNET